MKSSMAAAALAVALAPLAVSAFAGTYPILATSSIELDALSLLSPSHPSHKPTVFRPSAQSPFPSSAESDLCSLRTILLFTLPSLHSSDLATLSLPVVPKTQTLHVPYVPLKSPSTADKLVKTFVKECSAVVQSEGLASFWAGEEGKTVRVEQVKGLENWSLIGARAKAERKKVMHELEMRIAGQLATIQGPYLILITTLPAESLKALLPASKHNKAHQNSKRQFDEDLASFDGDVDFIGDDATGIATPTTSEMVPLQEETTPPKSIFEPAPNSGLLHRYVFFTPPLIFALGISLLILVPVLIFTANALSSIETVAGLEAKMTGTVGLDPAKA